MPLPGCNLTAQDKTELDLFKAQALGAAKPRPAAPAPEALQLPVPSHAHATQAFLPYLILSMEPPIPGATKETLLQLGTSPTQENVLKHFWTYWTLILNKTITLKDLSSFYLPIPAPPGTDPALVEAVDFARRTLLSLAATNEAISGLQDQLFRLRGSLADNNRASKALKEELVKEINSLLLYEELVPLGQHNLSEESSLDECVATLNYINQDRVGKAEGYIGQLRARDSQRIDINREINEITQKFQDVDLYRGLKVMLPRVPNQEIFKLKKKLLEKEIIPTGGVAGKLVSFYDLWRQGKHNAQRSP